MTYKGKGKGSNPNSLKNLEATKKKPGERAYPGAGRPKGSISLRERLGKYLEMEVPEQMPNGSFQKIPMIESIILAMLAKGKLGDMTAIKETLDRYYGKEVQPTLDLSPEKEETIINIEERIRKYAKHD